MLNLMYKSSLLFVTVLQISEILCEEFLSNPIVRVNEGQLRGTTYDLVDGSTCYAFRGVPFAQPPVGDLRFKAPLPPLPWEGVRDAINFGPICTQFNVTQQGEEDCLFVSIYTKSLQPDSKSPVIVNIHGGSYNEGSGDFFSPDLLMLHEDVHGTNIVFVTLNYRLELLGYLSLDTPEVPGNAGMKDQVAALRWIKNNIAQFGGDPNCVTLLGESSGASSVTYHMFSPMSTGLFHRVIAESGVCTNDWAIARNMKARAFRAGKILGTDTDDVNVLLDYLRGLEAGSLTNLTTATSTVDEQLRGFPEQFIPVVEKKHSHVEAFITENPLKMLAEGKVINKVPLMLGYNSAEGLYNVQDHVAKLDIYNNKPSYYVPREVSEKVSKKTLKQFGARIKKFYFGDKNMTKGDMNTIAELLTDTEFSYNIHRFTHLYTKLSLPAYLYRFDLVTDLNIVKIVLLGLADLNGVSHGDDLWYLFYNWLNEQQYKQQANLRDIVFRVTKLWVNFARTGNPTPDDTLGAIWKPYSTHGKEYFKIDETFALGHKADERRMQFWDKLYSNAGQPHIVTSTN
ncbi:jg13989 [Pararge aegeria aegeria]|uniref:Carboxylic ester hydrolase n=1 Tax=Pararge aegeria aegeria TaxID=348720 RepID=A0A8S4R9U5_9NEOP|nr:jg13989 [Pararge aegeria aegeria]